MPDNHQKLVEDSVRVFAPRIFPFSSRSEWSVDRRLPTHVYGPHIGTEVRCMLVVLARTSQRTSMWSAPHLDCMEGSGLLVGSVVEAVRRI